MEQPAMSLPLSLAPETFTRHATALRALARSLLRDPADVDDVVQETWIACLESPPAQRESLGSWLATVLRRRASNRRRSQARRTQHESVAHRPATFDPRETQQREATLNSVVAALGVLDEPLKQVVLLRYFEGLPPREVAARLGVEPRVVYDRLQRAHAKLRTRLEREFGSAHALQLALGALCGEPFGEAAALGELGRATSSSTRTWTSASHWSAAPIAIGAAAALSLAVFVIARRQGSERDATSGGTGAAAAFSGSSSALARDQGASAAAMAPTQLGGGSREPVESSESEVEARVMPQPTFELALEITVLDRFDRTAAFQSIYAAPAGGTLNFAGFTDENGRFVLRTRSWRADAQLDLTLGDGSLLQRVDLTREQRSIILRTPQMPNVVLNDVPLVEEPDSLASGSTVTLLSTRMRYAPHTTNDFSQRLTFFEPGLAFGARAQDEDPEAPQQRGSEFVDTLGEFVSTSVDQLAVAERAVAPTSRISGVVLDALGAPRGDVIVSRRRVDDGAWTSESTDEHGRFEFEQLAAGEYVLHASGGVLGLDSDRMTVQEGKHASWTARLELGSVFEGTLVDAAGRPLHEWSVEVEGASDTKSTRTDAEGHFKLVHAPAGALRVLARPITLPATPPLVLADNVFAADGPRKFALELTAEKSLGELRVALPDLGSTEGVTAADGESLERRRKLDVRVWRLDSQRGVSTLLADPTVGGPRIAHAMLLPGEHRVEVLLAGREPQVIGSVFVAAGEVRELSVSAAPGARIEFTAPAHAESMHAVLLRRGESFDALTSLPALRSRIAELRPGVYSAWNALDGGWLGEFTAEPGAALQVQLAANAR